MRPSMWCVVGLGNPGPRYRWNRHNVGFQFIDRLCQASGIRISRRDPRVAWGEGTWCGEPVILARPQTFMNRSGEGVIWLLQRTGCDPGSLVVVHDDMDLPIGRIKFKQKGGDGGHKGVRSIRDALRADRFLRLRIGIGRPPQGVEAEDYVLDDFSEDEQEDMERSLDRAIEALRTLLIDGLGKAMSQYHTPMQKEV